MARVLVTRHVPPGGLDPLVTAGHDVVQRAEDRPYSAEELQALVPEVDGMVCMLTDRITADVLEAGAAGRLRVVANAAVGVDNVDVARAHALGLVVCNTPGVLDRTTADLAFLLLLAATRQASAAEADLREGRWTGWSYLDHLAHDVHGSILGLVGYGRIAREVARRATGFGMEVLHHTRHDTGLPGYDPDLRHMLGMVDAVSLHVPLTPETTGLIGRRELAAMKPTAVLVNTARGAVVDEEALADALEAGTIFGAGLDVYVGEPSINPRLLAAPRTVLLPHIGSATVRTRTAMARLACEAVCQVLAGQRPANALPA